MNDMKKCSRCGLLKLRTEFYIRKTGRIWSCCKKCWTIDKKYKYHNSPITSEHMKNWFRKPKGRYVAYRAEAKRKGYEFKIEFSSFDNMIHSTCFYCGKESSSEESIGIDRVDSNIGYLIDNCVPCCSECNYSKRTRSRESFIGHCKRVVKYQESTNQFQPVSSGES